MYVKVIQATPFTPLVSRESPGQNTWSDLLILNGNSLWQILQKNGL